MPYVKRDKDNQVIAIYAEAPSDDAEYLAASHQDVIGFLNLNASEEQSLQFLTSSDYELVRVLEDLIELLMDKNLVLFTELPSAAQRKLVQRRKARQNLREENTLMVDEDDIL